MVWRNVLAAVLAISAVAIFGRLGLAQELGAHPFWADKVIIGGYVGGLVVWLIFWLVGLGMSARLGIGLIALVASFAVARYGANGFAVSYGEDQMAGKLWFFGWHATMISFFVFIAAISGKVLKLARR